MKAGSWLLSIQHADGGWQGGRVGEGRPSIVFNTAQVIRGILAVHAITGEERYREAAMRAGQWIVSVQDADGAWRGANFMGTARVYDTYVDAPLLQLSVHTEDTALRTSVLRNLKWVLAQQQTNGWFANADNTIRHNDRPITHTIAYTLDGLLECARILGDDRFAQAATQAAGALADRYLSTGRLHGRYVRAWNGRPEHGFRAAGLFWHENGCNEFTDKDDVLAVSQLVNCGRKGMLKGIIPNGLDDRKKKLVKAKQALGLQG